MKRIRLPIWLLSIFFVFSALPALSEGTLTLPESLTEIKASAFAADTSLSEIVFGPKIASVRADAFNGCENLTRLVFQGGNLDFNEDSNWLPASATEAVFESGVTYIGENTFKRCLNLKRLVFKGTGTVIAEGAFSSCPDGTVVIAPFAGDAAALINGKEFISPEYRALLVGQEYSGAIDDAGKDATLHGCIEDAESLARMLYAGKDPSLNARQIVDYHIVVDDSAENKSVWTEDISASDIPNMIPKVLTAKTDNDVSLFYFSGHGTTNQTGQNSYLVGKNGDGLDYISGSQLRTALDRIPGKKIVIIDACYSGGLIGRGTATPDPSFAESFISSFSLSSRNGELASDDYFVIVSASVIDGNKLSVSIKEGPSENPIYYGLFTRFFTEAFGWDRIVSSASGYGEWKSFDSLELPADAGTPKDGYVTLKEAYLYTDRKVESFITDWNQSHTAEKDKIYQVTKVWPYAENGDDWPDIADLILFGWAQNPMEGGE